MNLGDFNSDDLKDVYKLYKSFEENRAGVYGTKEDRGSGKVTDLFFVHTGHGLEFIEKYSIKGQWNRFTNWVQRQFGGKNSLDIQRNLQTAGELFERLSKGMNSATREELDAAAKSVGVKSGETLRRALQELGEHLNQLKYRTTESLKERTVERRTELLQRNCIIADELVRKIFKSPPEVLKNLDSRMQQVLSEALSKLGIKEGEGEKRMLLKISEMSGEELAQIEPLFENIFSCLSSVMEEKGELSQFKGVLDRLRMLIAQVPEPAGSLQGRLHSLEKIHIPKISERIESTFDEYRHNRQVQEKNRRIQGVLPKATPLKDKPLEAVTRVLSSISEESFKEVEKGGTPRLLSILRQSLGSVSASDKPAIREAISKLSPPSSAAGLLQSDSTPLLESSFVRGQELKSDTLEAQKVRAKDFLSRRAGEFFSGTSLKDIIDNAIPVANANRESVSGAMKSSGNKVFILGGSKDHPMVYEFERINANKEEGRKQTWNLRVYDEKQGCLEYVGLTKKQLLGRPSKGFFDAGSTGALGSLQKLQDMSGSQALDAFKQAVEQLERSTEGIDQLFQSGPSGIKASRALQAALIGQISDESEKIRFLFEYDLDLFEQVELQIAQLTSLKESDFRNGYDEHRKLYSVIERVLPEFAERVKDWQSSLTKEDHVRVKDLRARYEDLLDQLNTKLIECEKKLYTDSLKTLTEVTTPFSIAGLAGQTAPPDLKAREVELVRPERIDVREQAILTSIEEIPERDHADFSKKVKTTLQQLGQLSSTSGGYFYVCDVFFKKLGTIDVWQHIDDPSITKELAAFSNNLASTITLKTMEGSRPERYGMFLFAKYGVDRLFHKWAEGAKFPGAFSSPLASADVYEEVKSLRTSDPFWASTFGQIKELREALELDERMEVDELFGAKLYENSTEFALSNQVVRSVIGWTRSTTGTVGSTIRKSIEADRTAQAEEIHTKIEIEKANLHRLEGEEKQIEGEIASAIARKQQLEEELKVKPDEAIADDIIKLLDKRIINKLTQKQRDGIKAKILEVIEEKLLRPLQQQGQQRAHKLREDTVAASIFSQALKPLLGTQGILNSSNLGISGITQKGIESSIGSGKISGIVKGRIESVQNKYRNMIELHKIEKTELPKLNNNLVVVQEKIQVSKDLIDFGIRVTVRKDEGKKYWPWGIGEKDEQDPKEASLRKWNNAEVASFYFSQGSYVEGKAKVSALPSEFRSEFVDMALSSRNIFHKNSDVEIPPIYIFEKNGVLQRSKPSGFTRETGRPDPYFEAFGRQKSSYADVYEHVLSQKYVDELKIPHMVAVGLDQVVEEEQMPRKEGLQARAASLFGAVKGVFVAVKERVFGPTMVALNDEVREICQLHCSKEIQIDSVITYFQENPKKLFESDGRLLFHTLLFESDLLLQALRDPQAKELLVPSLQSLFHDTITSSSQLGDIESAADICWLASSVQKQINFLVSTEGKDLGQPVLSADTLFTLIANFAAIGNKEKWPTVYESLLAASGNLIQRPLEADSQKQLVVYGLVARMIQKRHPMTRAERAIYDKKASEFRSRDADHAEKLFKELLPVVSPRMVTKAGQKVLGTMYEALKGADFVEDKQKRPGVFVTEDGATTLSLTDGRLVSTDSKVFQQYADPVEGRSKNLLQGVYTEADIGALRCYREENVVCIYDSTKNLYLKVDENKDAIFIKNGNVWCHLLTRDSKLAFDNQTLSTSLLQLYDAANKEVYFCDTVTFQPLYKSEGQKIVKIGETLSLSKPPENSPLANFEDPSCSFYWSDGQVLSLIEFPRLGLSLEKNEKGRWVQQGATEWMLAEDQFVPHLEQKNGFLVFENKKGEKKALFPVWDVSKRADSQAVQYDFRTEEKSGRYVEYGVETDRLVPKTIEARFYLSKIYFEKGDINKVENLMYARAAEVTSRKLSKEEVSGLESVIRGTTGKEASPRSLRLRMHAQYLLEKNNEQFPKEVLKEEKMAVRSMPSIGEIKKDLELVTAYLDHVSESRPLEAHEELLVLTKLQRKIDRQIELQEKDIQSQRLEIVSPVRECIQERIAFLADALNPASLGREVDVAVPGVNTISQLSFFDDVGDKGGVIRLLRKDYFEESKAPLKEIQVGELFPVNSPEIAHGDEFAKKKFENVSKDMKVAQERVKGEKSFSLKAEKDVTVLGEQLNKQLTDERQLLSHEETLIVNAVATALRSNPVAALELDSKMRFYPNIEELCLLCARKNYQKFAEKYYPELGKEGIESLQMAVKKYLFQKETVQQLERSLDLLTVLQTEKSPEMKEVLQNRLVATMDSMRAYPPDHKLAMIFLFLETTLNIKLRPDQVKNILLFEGGVEADKEKVLQMIMGAGKTSVLQPILALLFARPDRLSTIMVPEAQFQAVREQLVGILGAISDQYVYSLPYDLELAKDPDYLDDFLKNLKEVKGEEGIEGRGCLLMPPRIKHSILTSLYGAYQEADDVRIEKISAICKFMEKHELIQIDEIDMIMNPNIVFKRPIGERIIYDKDNDFARPKIMAELLLHLAKSQKLGEEVSIDFVNVMQGSDKVSSNMTEKLYVAKVRPELVDKACLLLAERGKNLKGLIDHEYFRHFIAQDLPEGELREKVNAWIVENVTDPGDRELLAACAQAIGHIFPNSLQKECNAHYGKDPRLDHADSSKRQFVARPYEAPDAPKQTAYAYPPEKIIYSISFYIYNGIPLADAREMFLEWQVHSRNQTRREAKPLEATNRYQKFQQLMSDNQFVGVDFRIDEKSAKFDEVIDRFQKAISKDPETLMEFFNKKVFPQVTVYEKTVTSTPHTLTGSGKTAHGYTGTLDLGILAASMTGIPEVGTDGQTILAVETKIINGDAKVEICSDDKGKLLTQVVDQFKSGTSVFIDSGGWLKQEKIGNYANRLLDECRDSGRAVEGVVYHNEEGKIVCLEIDERGSKTIVPFELSRLKNSPEKRLTIIAQKYETGTNIGQTLDAKAFMSVRKDMTLRDGLQSIFRMRGILVGQSVSIGLSEEVKSHISNALVEGLLSHHSFANLFTGAKEITETDLNKAIDDIKKDGKAIDDAIETALKKAVISYNEFLRKNPESSEKECVIAFLSGFSKEFTPTSKNIWKYFEVNQIKTGKQKGWAAATYRMQEIIEKPIRSLLTDPKISLDERKSLFKSLEDFLVQTESDKMFDKLTAPPPAVAEKNRVEKEVKRYLDILENEVVKGHPLYSQICEGIEKEYGEGEIKAVLEKELTECCKDVSGEQGEDLLTGAAAEVEAQEEVEIEMEEQEEAQVEAEKQQEAQVEVEVSVQKVLVPKPRIYEPLAPVTEQKSYDINKLVSTLVGSQNRPLSAILPDDLQLPGIEHISYSPNLFSGKNQLNSKEQASEHIAARYFLVCKERGKSVNMLISHQDYALIKKELKTTTMDPGKEAVVYSLAGAVKGSPKGPSILKQDIEKTLRPTLVLAKFCTIKSHFSPEEVDLLMESIQNGPPGLGAACRDYYEGRLNYLETAKKEYYSGDNDLEKKLSAFGGGRRLPGNWSPQDDILVT